MSYNCLGRAYLLARVLQRQYSVEIVGPIFGNGIWEPLAEVDDLSYKTVGGGTFPRFPRFPRFLPQIRELLREITGDVIYASKPLFTSYGIGLLRKLASRRPLILDIDDWQMGFRKENLRNLSPTQRIRSLVDSAAQPHRTGSYWNSLFCQQLIRLTDEITVSNRFLQEKFGGTIVCHGRDTEALNPEKFDKDLLRERYGIGKNIKLMMFFGTLRPHKGIEDLIEATSQLRDREIMLTLVGVDIDNYSKNVTTLARQKLGERFKAFGLQPFQKVPEFLVMSDVVVIPQNKTFATIGQTPAKVFDAMAMAKPIIATAVSDLPEILDGCGWIVESENPQQLAQAIQYVVDHPEESERVAWKARQKCVERYSWDAIESVLVNVFEKYRQDHAFS